MIRRLFFTCAAALLSFLCAYASEGHTVIHTNWQFRQRGVGEWLPAQVPGTVHTDLLENGQIPDPYYGARQQELQWIDKVDWEYRCRFDAEDAVKRQNVRLTFDGIDCFADIYLNGTHLASTDNMFRTWTYDVKGVLRARNNELHVILHSPVMKGLSNLSRYGVRLRANNDLSVLGGLGPNKVSIYTRKSGYQYGWDLTPRYVTSGIWRPVRLESWDDARIDELYVYTKEIGKNRASLGVSLRTEQHTSGDYSISYQIHPAYGIPAEWVIPRCTISKSYSKKTDAK